MSDVISMAKYLALCFLVVQAQGLLKDKSHERVARQIPSQGTPNPLANPKLDIVSDTAGVKTPGLGSNSQSGYLSMQVSEKGSNLEIVSFQCGNGFILTGLFLVRVYGKDHNMVQEGPPRMASTKEGLQVSNVTHIAGFAQGGISLTIVVYGNCQVYDISKGLTIPIRWDDILHGVRSIMLVNLNTNMRIIITGNNLIIIRVAAEFKITIHNIYGINIMVPCGIKDFAIVIRQKPVQITATDAGSATPVATVESNILQYTVSVKEMCIKIEGPDSATYRGKVKVEGKVELPPGQTVQYTYTVILFGASIDMTVPVCWNVTETYESCTGQIIVLTIQKPGTCYLIVLLAKPKCDPDFDFKTDSNYNIKGVYGVHFLPSTSASCCTSSTTLPPVNVLNGLFGSRDNLLSG